MAYEVVIWLYDRLSDSAFDNEDTLKKAIGTLDDNAGRLTSWIENDGDWLNRVPDEPSKYKDTFRERILANQKDEVNELIKDIMSAESPEDMPEIGSAEMRRRFGKDQAERLLKAEANRLKDFESLEERYIRETTARILSADTSSELDSIDISDAPTTRSETQLTNTLDRRRSELIE